MSLSKHMHNVPQNNNVNESVLYTARTNHSNCNDYSNDYSFSIYALCTGLEAVAKNPKSDIFNVTYQRR